MKWKNIRDYNYEVSTNGDIRNKKTGRLLKQRTSTYGYKLVDIQVNKKNKTFISHILIAETFLGEGSDGYQVDHINRVRDDNRIDNLRWVTPKENSNNKNKVSKKLLSKVYNLFLEGVSLDEVHQKINF